MPPPSAAFIFSCSISRASRLASACRRWTISTPWSGVRVQRAERRGRAPARCCWQCATAPAPVSASMRRTPAATPLSCVMTKKPMSPVARTCVPPHSSMLKTVADRDDADAVAVFLAEQRHRAGGDRFFRRSHVGLHRRVAVDLLVDDALDVVELLARDRLEVHEVEAQPIGRDERAGLLDVRAEHLAQRRVQQVRRRVIAPRRVARSSSSTTAVHEVARLERAARDTSRGARAGRRRQAARDRSTCADAPVASLTMVPLSDTCPPDST